MIIKLIFQAVSSKVWNLKLKKKIKKEKAKTMFLLKIRK